MRIPLKPLVPVTVAVKALEDSLSTPVARVDGFRWERCFFGYGGQPAREQVLCADAMVLVQAQYSASSIVGMENVPA